MKIAYVIAEDISGTSGVLKKIVAKIKFWKLYGHEVSVISLKSNMMEPLIKEGVVLSKYIKEKSFKKKFLRRFTISKKLDQYLSEFMPDIIYARYIGNSPDIAYVFKKHAPYIVEVNTNDVEEFKNGKVSREIFNLLTRNYFLGNANGFVSVSKELMIDKTFTKFNISFTVIGNGYDFDAVSVKKKKYSTDKIVFIFIGSPNQVWHGSDKILKLANKLKDCIFHIVGPTKQDLEKLGILSENIICHGYRDKEYIEKLILKCDIGISSLALHRNNMMEASPLKSREYLAYGLPIILGYQDTDLPQDFKFALNIGNYENNVIDNLREIEAFANSFKMQDPSLVINNSKKYLDYQEKEKKRIDFIKEIWNKGI